MSKIKYVVALSLLGILAMPMASMAQSVASGSAASELQALVSQLHVLQAELAARTGGSVLGAQCATISGPLGAGSSGSQVTALQTALQKSGFSVRATGAFDTQTTAAVKQFQSKYASVILAPSKLSVATGYAGERTIAQLNTLSGCSAMTSSGGMSSTAPAISIHIGPIGHIGPYPPAALTASENSAVGTQIVSSGATNQLVGSYSFAASSAEGVNVNTVSIMANVSDFQNLHLIVNGVQFGTTQGVVSPGSVYTFSGPVFTVPAGSVVNVGVYADILSSASGSSTAATTLSGCTGSGAVVYDAITCNAPVQGQGMVVSGAPTITVSADVSSSPVEDVVMGSMGNSLTTFRFSETSNTQNVKVTDLTITDTITPAASTTKPTFSNLQMWNGTTILGTAGAPTIGTMGQYVYTFHFSTPVIILQGSSLSLTLRGDAAASVSGAATDDSTHRFGIAQPSDVVAMGAASNQPATVTLQSAQGNPQTVLRTLLTASGSPLGVSFGRMKSPADDLGNLTVVANPAGNLALNRIGVTFTGSAATSSLFALKSNVMLLDQNGNNIVSTYNATETIAMLGTNNYVVTWSFQSGTSGFQISAGSSYQFKLRINSAVIPSVPNIAESLTASVNNAADISWIDGLDSQAVANLGLPPGITPTIINNVSYAVGS